METIGNTNDNHVLIKATKEEEKILYRLSEAVHNRGIVFGDTHGGNLNSNMREVFRFMEHLAYSYERFSEIQDVMSSLASALNFNPTISSDSNLTEK